MSKVDDAVESASLLVADKIEAAAVKFEEIYKDFLDTYPVDVPFDLINDFTDTVVISFEEDFK